MAILIYRKEFENEGVEKSGAAVGVTGLLVEMDLSIPDGYYADISVARLRLTAMKEHASDIMNLCAPFWIGLRYEVGSRVTSGGYSDDKFIAGAVACNQNTVRVSDTASALQCAAISDLFLDVVSGFAVAPLELAVYVGYSSSNAAYFRSAFQGEVEIHYELKRLTVAASTEIATR